MEDITKRLLEWIKKNERNHAYTARHLGISEAMMSYLISGERKWSPLLREKAEKLMQGNNK
jgi:DNA-directed RNA polymerase specialized sigma subunit